LLCGLRWTLRGRLRAIRGEDGALAPDDLNTPLSRPAPRASSRWTPLLLPLVTMALAAIVLTGIGWAILVDDPMGGEPIATATITKPQPAKSEAPAAVAPKQSATGSEQTVTIIDGKSGVRTQVPVQGSDAANAKVGAGSALDSRLMEDSPHGPIPRIGPDGARPLDVYSRANGGGTTRKGPRIAIVVGGLGISEAATNESIVKLPGAVTFAFAPHTADLTRWTAKARDDGHEFLIQLPMEPFDYPDNDPGPQTLLTTLPKDQNIDRLYWFLSRSHGYVGVANFMGARFTANEDAMAPILTELSRRGLLYFDDGASTRSIVRRAADSAKAPYIKADIVIDAKPNWSDIDTALERLERLALEREHAVGVATALPVSIERIARWAKSVESRGIRIVPLSAVAIRGRHS
jgi:polysaccharide deacetylase 2 family uncharacterized protein YibQ